MTTMPKHAGAGISTYALYSEKPSSTDPEFIHIEDIKSRARLFNWKIGVHVHPRMFQLLYIRSGYARVIIDGCDQEVDTPCVISLPPGVPHGFEFARDETQGFVVTVSQMLLLDENFQRRYPFHEEMMRNANIIPLQENPGDVLFFDQVMQQLVDEYGQEQVGKKPMFEWFLYCLLMRLGRCAHEWRKPVIEDRYEQRHRRLCQLIEKHYRQHLPHAEYANMLCTTTVGLNRACQAVTGKSLSELIQDRLILEAQRCLIYSSATVAQIAYELGFSEPAYFSRFFKRRIGSSPREFREKRDGR